MRRKVSHFGLLILLAGSLPLAALLSAPGCYGRQNQQDSYGQQPGQPAAPPQQQQPPAGTTPPRPTSSPGSSSDPSEESSSKKALPPDDPAPAKTPADAPKKSKPGVSLPKTIQPGIRSTRSRTSTSECFICTKATWTPPSAVSNMPSACAPILPSPVYCWPSATRRKAIRPRPYATTRNICRCCRTRQTPRRSARRSKNSPRSNSLREKGTRPW